jgi:hypothetical protein
MYGEMEIRLHIFLNTKLGKMTSKLYEVVTLDWENGCRHSLNRTLSGHQMGSRHFWVKKNIFHRTAVETRFPVALPLV